MTEKLQKELKTLSETVAELSRLMAKDLDESLEDDSVQVHIERSKKALRESAAKIKRYSEELSEDYELSDEQKELLNKSAKAFGQSMRDFGEAMSLIARDLSKMIEEKMNESENQPSK
mgnify:FL=1